jgi:hypothetical protein
MSHIPKCTILSLVLTVPAFGVLPAAVSAQSPSSGYAGPAPVYGGDPAIGEEQASYWARTGDYMSQSMGAYGGHRVPGETDASYFARTGIARTRTGI